MMGCSPSNYYLYHIHLYSDNDINGFAFHEASGSICVMEMIQIHRHHHMDLRLMAQLILLEGNYDLD